MDDEDREWFRAFVAGHEWTYAKTMPDSPHEYLVRRKVNDDPAFDRAVELVREHGEKRRFGGHSYVYYDDGGFCFWSMGWPVKETIILNRAVVTPVVSS